MLVAPSSVPPNQYIIKVADMGLSVFIQNEYYISDNKDFAGNCQFLKFSH
jgi:hypothetical protein